MKIIIPAVLALMLMGCQSTSVTANQNIQTTQSEDDSKQIELEATFGITCFTQSIENRQESNDLYKQNQAERANLDSDVMKNLGAMTRIKQRDQRMLALGDPDAFLKQCRFGADRMAPLEMRENGYSWCALGLKMIPILATKVDPEFVQTLKSIENNSPEFAQEIKNREQRMCKI